MYLEEMDVFWTVRVSDLKQKLVCPGAAPFP